MDALKKGVHERGNVLVGYDPFALATAAASGVAALEALRRGDVFQARVLLRVMAAEVLSVDARQRLDQGEG